MIYKVDITAEAEGDMEAAYAWFHRNISPQRAVVWRYDIPDAVTTLKQFPARCPGAVEYDLLGHKLRRLNLQPYQIIFVIDGKSVTVLRILHFHQGL